MVRTAPRRFTSHGDGFTMVELLVTMSILAGLVISASSLYSTYVNDAKEYAVRQNLMMIRSAIQQFYQDQGRHPIHGRDLYGNSIGFTDNATSELVQGIRIGPSKFPRNRLRYMHEIPVDPSTNLVNWKLLTSRASDVKVGSILNTDVVTNVASRSKEYAHL